MNKAQAINNFWSSFDLPAYEEHTVPQDAKMPYITYNVATAEIDNYVGLYANIWDYGTSWELVMLKADEIALRVASMYPIKLDDGYLRLDLGTPFSQTMSDEDDMTRRVYINLQAEFLTFK